MYLQHYSLAALPFENVPDPIFFFDSGEHKRILERLTESFTAGRGLVVVAGPIGSGKTTLSQKLMSALPMETRLIWLGEPTDTSNDLLLFTLKALGASSTETSRVFLLAEIREKLMALHGAGQRCLLVMDEAHKMTDDVLECVRLLNNLEQGAIKLIQMILLGQEEFVARFSAPELAAFRQRIASLELLGRMPQDSIKHYVLHRLVVAGGQRPIFTQPALNAIASITGGVPRVINSLCDRALQFGFEHQQSTVDLREVKAAAEHLGLGREFYSFLLEMHTDTQHAQQEPENPDVQPVSGDEISHRPPAGMTPSGGDAMPSGDTRVTPEEASLRGPLILLAATSSLFVYSLWALFQKISAL